MDVYLNTRRDLLVVKSGCPIPAIAAGGWRKRKKRLALNRKSGFRNRYPESAESLTADRPLTASHMKSAT